MTVYYRDPRVTLLIGDAADQLGCLPAGSVDCVVTSPPYWGLRDYGVPGQHGTEPTPTDYVNHLRDVFDQARRALADSGTAWLNLGNCYSGQHRDLRDRIGAAARTGQRPPARGSGLPAKNLLGMPWRVAHALQADGWIVRNAIVWHKPNAMPESVHDRLTVSYELVFFLVKTPRYYFDLDPIREPAATPPDRRTPTDRAGGVLGRKYVGPEMALPGGSRWNDMAQSQHSPRATPLRRRPRDVWTISTRPYPGAHNAPFPVDLPARCIAAGCPPNGLVVDPYSGAGTTGLAALSLGRRYLGIDLNPAYHALARARLLDHVDSATPEPGARRSAPAA